MAYSLFPQFNIPSNTGDASGAAWKSLASFVMPVLSPLLSSTSSTKTSSSTDYLPYQKSYPAYGAESKSLTPPVTPPSSTASANTGITIAPSSAISFSASLEPRDILAEGLGKPEPPTFQLPDKSEVIIGLQAQYDTLVKQLETKYDEEMKSLQAMMAEQEKLMKQYQIKGEEYLKKYEELATKPLAGWYEQKLDEHQVKQNYFENQALLGELKMIMNELNMSTLRGAELIRSGAISKTEWIRRQNELTARAGILQAVINTRNNQIGVALNIIDKIYTVIKSDLERELNYYRDVINYYNQLRKELKNDIVDLTKEQRQYINAKINLTATQLDQMNKTVNYVKELMLNPQYASKLAYAGVSLLDDIPTINKKLADWNYVEELQTISREMAKRGYSEILTAQELALYPPEAIVQWQDSRKKIHYFVNKDYLQEIQKLQTKTALSAHNKITFKDITDNQGNITRIYTETDPYGREVNRWVEYIGPYGKASTSGGMADLLRSIFGSNVSGLLPAGESGDVDILKKLFEE